jgi:activator of HSP90 ATPase
MKKSNEISVILPASPEAVYKTWLDSRGHSEMTGSPAEITDAVHGRFTAWDGYISGSNLELKPFEKIIQSWRTTDFPDGAQDSRLEIALSKSGSGTKLILKHSNLPEGREDEFKQGWKDYYFEPMKAYFKSKKP